MDFFLPKESRQIYSRYSYFIIKSFNYLYHGIKCTLNVEVQLMRQLVFGKDNAAKVDDSLGINHLAVCCDGGQLTFDARF